MITKHWNGKTSKIKDILEQFGKLFEMFQDFWYFYFESLYLKIRDQLEDLDKHTWILEPEYLNYRDKSGSSSESRFPFGICFRRIALGNHCSMQITVDPLRPRSVPDCQFLGSESTINPLRDKLNKNLNKWNIKKFLRENLETVIDFKFPSRTETNAKEDGFTLECGICYGFKLNNAIPGTLSLVF